MARIRFVTAFRTSEDLDLVFFCGPAEENREWLRDLAKAFRDYPRVVEVRHISWNEPDFYAELVSSRMGIVNLDQPMFRNSLPPSARATSAASAPART